MTDYQLPPHYDRVRRANDVMGIVSMHPDKQNVVEIHGYQLGGTCGGTSRADVLARLRAEFGAPMTTQELLAMVRDAAAAGSAVFAVPAKDGMGGQNVCLHFPDEGDWGWTHPQRN